MHFDQLFSLPYAHFWIPGGIFVAVGSGLFWFLRHSPFMVGLPTQNEGEHAGSVRLRTAHLDTEKAPKEQRASKRRTGNPVQVRVATDPDQKADLKPGYVLDRSLGGIRLVVYDELPVGTILAIRPNNVIDMVPWVDVEVRSCRPSVDAPGEFDAGCQFVKAPPFSILMLFG